MELSQVEPVKLILGYDSGQTLTFPIKTLRYFLLHSQPGTNGEVEKILSVSVEYTEVAPGREVVRPLAHYPSRVNQPPAVSGDSSNKSLNETTGNRADLEMLAANLMKSYQTGSLGLLAAELLFLLTDHNRGVTPRITANELALLITSAAHAVARPERSSTEISEATGEARPG